MGTVFRGVHMLLERPVALKRLRADHSMSDLARKRFLREAQAAARLNHPTVVQIYDIFEHEGDAWIAMELVDGSSLSELTQGKPLPWPRAVTIGSAIATALREAHAVAILHRDLKAENVLLTPRGEVKVLDFGLAKDLVDGDVNESLSHTQGLAGTPRCMSPEQAMGIPLDPRSDLFSLGVLLYELLTGTSPFAGPTVMATLYNLCSVRQVSISQLDPSIPEELSRLVDALLEKEPDRRPNDAERVATRLAAIEARAPDGASEAPSPPAGQPGVDAAISREALGPTAIVPMPSARPRPAGSQSSDTSFGERRQLLVLSCELSADDPEELYAALPMLQERARSLATEHRGLMIDDPGARLVTCVGYPQAFEDDARRALTIATALLDQASELAASHGLRARCGLHAGIAFTPAEPTDRPPALGVILDQAIEIARTAAVGQLVVSAAAKPLIPDRVQTQALDTTDRGESLFAVRSGTDPRLPESPDWPVDTLTPTIGRETEIRLLEESVSQVIANEFRVVQVCGEGGIGKTKLLAGLRDRLASKPLEWITLAGFPETANSPFYPITTLLGHIFGLALEGPVEDQALALEARVAALDLPSDDLLPRLAPFLSPTLERAYPQPALAPETRKQHVFEALSDLLSSLADTRPIVLVIEDLHWLDPSTLEWIGRLIDERSVASLFVVLTFRPRFAPPWGHRADIVHLNLNPLAREPTRRLIDEIIGQAELPPRIIERIIDKTDGVPLFLEQLTRSVLETVTDDETPEMQLPGTLRASLTARLDRLGASKAVAQYASVIGREFPLDVLRAIVPLDAQALETQLKHLVDARIFMRRGLGRRARYVFKHALLRDAAYDSLLHRDRRMLHAEIVRVAENTLPRLVQRNPEILAHHCARGGLLDEAVAYWARAATGSLERSANLEAISHCAEGLGLLASLASSDPRRELELTLRAAQVQALTSAKGFATPEIGPALRRLDELATRAGDDERLTAALRGLVRMASFSGDSALLLTASQRFLEHAQALDDAALNLEAHFHSGMTAFSRGALPEAAHHHEECLRIDAEIRDLEGETLARSISGGRAVISRSLLALNCWLRGRSNQAFDLIRQAIVLARQTEPLMQALTYENSAALFLFMDRYDGARENAAKGLEVSLEHELFTERLARIVLELVELRACGAVEGGDTGDADEDCGPLAQRVRTALDTLRASGGRFGLSFYCCQLGKIALARGDLDTAASQLAAATELIEALDERVYLPEVLRLRAEIQGRLGHDDAEQLFTDALELARAQGSCSLELRACLGLLRHQAADGQPSETAIEHLRTLLESLDDEAEVPDVLEAARWLDR